MASNACRPKPEAQINLNQHQRQPPQYPPTADYAAKSRRIVYPAPIHAVQGYEHRVRIVFSIEPKQMYNGPALSHALLYGGTYSAFGIVVAGDNRRIGTAARETGFRIVQFGLKAAYYDSADYRRFGANRSRHRCRR